MRERMGSLIDSICSRAAVQQCLIFASGPPVALDLVEADEVHEALIAEITACPETRS